MPFLGVADGNLWLDEIYTYNVATAPWREHLELVYRVYDHPPLFFHLAWLVGRLSDSPAVLGLLPALCVAASGMVLARSLWTSEPEHLRCRTVAIFAVFFALCPEVCYQAWNLRHYGMLALCGSLYLASWTAALAGDTRAHRLSALFAGLGLLTHHFMVFPIAAVELVGGGLLWSTNRRFFREGIAPRATIFLPCVLAWGAVAWAQYPGSGGELVANLLSYRGLPALRQVWERFHGAPLVTDLPSWQGWVALAVGLALVPADLLLLRRGTPSDRVWLAMAYLPIAGVFALSLLKPCLASRFLIVSAAALMGVHAKALARLGRWGIGGAAGAAAVMAIGLFFHLSSEPQFPPYAEYIPQILRTVGPDDVLVLPPGSMPDVYAYYARRNGMAPPRCIAIPVPVVDRAGYQSALAELPEKLAPYRRAWVVYELPRFWDPENGTQNLLEARWTLGPYQELWGKRWVLTYYDNPARK